MSKKAWLGLLVASLVGVSSTCASPICESNADCASGETCEAKACVKADAGASTSSSSSGAATSQGATSSSPSGATSGAASGTSQAGSASGASSAGGSSGASSAGSGGSSGGSGTSAATSSSGGSSSSSSGIPTTDILVSVLSSPFTTEAGGTATFTVQLLRAPGEDVNVPLESSNPNEVAVVPSLVFTPSNYNVAQTVTLTGQDDRVDDGNQTVTIRFLPTLSYDNTWYHLVAPAFTVVNNDNDTAALVVTTPGNNHTQETLSPSPLTITVALATQPTGEVRIPVVSSRPQEGVVSTSELTFDAMTWETAQTVEVLGFNDDVDDGDQAYTVTLGPAAAGDPLYVALAPHVVDLVNDDDDTAGLVVAPLSGAATSENGDTATLRVRLASQPTGDVQVRAVSSNVQEATVPSGALTFTPANWATPQDLVVTGVNDNAQDGTQGYTVTVSVDTTMDTRYATVAPAVAQLTNSDNDTAGFTVNPSAGLVTTEQGGTATFTVNLNTVPTAELRVSVTSTAPTEGTVSTSELVFAMGATPVAQQVTITGANDEYADGDTPYTIHLALVSGPPEYQGQVPGDVQVTNTDNDVVGISGLPTMVQLTSEATQNVKTFNIALNSKPLGDVTVAPTTSDPTEGEVTTPVLTFTPGNWNVAQVVSVKGVNDDIDDGTQAYTMILAVSSMLDPQYEGLVVPGVSFSNADDDTAAVTVTVVGGGTEPYSTNEGGTVTKQFTIKLATQPVGAVTVGVSVNNALEGRLSASDATFTNSNWGTAATITVSGVNDDFADGNVGYLVMVANAQSATDAAYDNKAPNITVLSMVNVDDDTPGLVFTASSYTVNEPTGSTPVSVRLGSRPQQDVTVSVQSSDTTHGALGAGGAPATLMFTGSNWNIPQAATLSAVDDSYVDGTVTYTLTATTSSADPQYSNRVVMAPASTLDDDAAGLVLSTLSASVTEGQAGAPIQVHLGARPRQAVTVTITSGNTGAGTITGSPLTFTSADWSMDKTFTLTAVNDMVANGQRNYAVTLASTSTDLAFQALGASVSATTLDNDLPGLVFSPSSLSLTEPSGTATLAVSLATQPTASVTVTVTSLDTSEATVPGTILTFTTMNWATPQNVVVTVADDLIADGDQTYSIHAAAASGDSNYNGLADDVAAVTHDNDAPGMSVSPALLEVTEPATPGVMSVVLSTQPTSDVVVTVTSSNTAVAAVGTGTITFTTANWSTPHMVTINAVNDAIAGGDQTFTITFTASSADTSYNTMVRSGNGVRHDDDVPGIILGVPTVSITEGMPGAAVTVRLMSQPTVAVTINVTSTLPAFVTATPDVLTFVPGAYGVNQTVTLGTPNDNIAFGTRMFTTTFTPVSADPKYTAANLTPPTLGGTLFDNDTRGMVVNKTTVTVNESGTTDTIGVRLASQPQGNVTVTALGDQPLAGTVSGPLTFTNMNWNTNQFITVTPTNDDVADGSQAWSITLASSGADYDGVPNQVVTATTLDDDIKGFVFSAASFLVGEPVGTTQVGVRLRSRPTGTVLVTASSSDSSAGTVTLGGSLTFTTGNWSTFQQVTLMATNDLIADGTQSFHLNVQASGADYNSQSASLPGQCTDDDVAGYVLSNGTINTNEAGAGVVVTLSLRSQPANSVIVDVASQDAAQGTVSVSQLVFTSSNWMGVPFTVTSVNNALCGNSSYTVALDVRSGSDAAYAAINPPDVTVNSLDNDKRMFLVPAANGNVGGIAGADALCNGTNRPAGYGASKAMLFGVNAAGVPIRDATTDWVLAPGTTYCTNPGGGTPAFTAVNDPTHANLPTVTVTDTTIALANPLWNSGTSYRNGMSVDANNTTHPVSMLSYWTCRSTGPDGPSWTSTANQSKTGSLTSTGDAAAQDEGTNAPCNTALPFLCVEQ